MKRYIYILWVISLLFTACKSEEGTSPIRKDIKELVFASGQIEWQDTYDIVAQTDGVLESLDVEEGVKVIAGQLLGKIQNPGNLESLSASQSQLELAKANALPVIRQLEQNISFAQQKYEQDRVQAERYQRLFENQSVSKQEFETQQLNAENSLSQLKGLKDQLEVVKIQNRQVVASAQSQKNTAGILSAYNQLKSPLTGKVIKKLKSVGDYVRKGEAIATVANDRDVEIQLNIDERSMMKLKPGQQVFVKLNIDPDKIYNAVISEIPTSFDVATQSFVCKARFEDSELRPPYATQLEGNILVGEKKNALLIPRELVGYGNKVRIKDEKLPVTIVPGIISTDYVEVLEGLTEDAVILPVKQ